jgi:hypothetical protein
MTSFGTGQARAGPPAAVLLKRFITHPARHCQAEICKACRIDNRFSRRFQDFLIARPSPRFERRCTLPLGHRISQLRVVRLSPDPDHDQAFVMRRRVARKALDPSAPAFGWASGRYLLMRVVGDEAPGLGAQTIHRGCRRDVKRPVVVVSPGEVGWLFRHLDRA